MRQEKPADWNSPTQAAVAIETPTAWILEHRRQPFGGVRLVLVPNPDKGPAGPDREFAAVLR